LGRLLDNVAKVHAASVSDEPTMAKQFVRITVVLVSNRVLDLNHTMGREGPPRS
jgi:hypothetical protein